MSTANPVRFIIHSPLCVVQLVSILGSTKTNSAALSEHLRGRLPLHLLEHLRNPRPHRDKQACTEPLVKRQGRILIVQLGEVDLQPSHMLLDDGVRVSREHAAYECEVLA